MNRRPTARAPPPHQTDDATQIGTLPPTSKSCPLIINKTKLSEKTPFTRSK